MVYLFNEVHERYFGAGADYKDIKKSYNDLVLGMEDRLRKEIEGSTDPLAKALIMARIGNYIDFGAMNHVDEDEFLSLFSDTDMRDDDRATYESFLGKPEEDEYITTDQKWAAKSGLLKDEDAGFVILL